MHRRRSRCRCRHRHSGATMPCITEKAKINFYLAITKFNDSSNNEKKNRNNGFNN